MKLNGNKNIILDGDVIVTSPSKIGKTLGEVIDEQQQDINRLKSNVKYIYSYGGVGGTGSGGGSGSSGNSSDQAQLYVTLNNKEIGDSPILLNGEGDYEFYAKVRKSGGERFFLRMVTGDNPNINIAPRRPLSTELNNCEYTEMLNIKKNGMIRVQLLDNDGDPVGRIVEQYYLLKQHEFSSSFKCVFNDNVIGVNNNEYLMSSINGYSNPFLELDYRINVSGSSDVKINVQIDDFYNETISQENILDVSNEPLRINLNDITRNNVSLISDENSGRYHVILTLSYKDNLLNDVSESIDYYITLIPDKLFISIREDKNVTYDTLEKMKEDFNSDKIPSRTVNNGEFISYYPKVFDGEYSSSGIPMDYTVKCNVYNYDSTIDDFIKDEMIDEKSIIVSERIESRNGLSLSFSSPGIKKLIFSTQTRKTNRNPKECEYAVYVYVKRYVSQYGWSIPDLLISEHYFRSNQGDETYSEYFPKLSSLDNVFELRTTSSPLTLFNTQWNKMDESGASTILSFGIQLNTINVENCKIFELYSSVEDIEPIMTLRSNILFNNDDNNILIPSEDMYNSGDNKKYHLVQIVRQKLNKKNDTSGENKFINVLYIDGKLECCDFNIYSNSLLRVGKIILNNINISYNLINIQYARAKGDKNVLDIDSWIYRYWLSYKEKYININDNKKISDDEEAIYQQMDNMIFDGENLITSVSTVQTIAKNITIPTMMFDYCPGSENIENALIDDPNGGKGSWQKFMSDFLKGYKPGDSDEFGKKLIKLFYSSGNGSPLNEIKISEINGLVGDWYFGFQGTSTMTNRIKNFSLYLVTRNNEENLNILFSPNFKKGTTEEAIKTFLPEKEWTIKADIADSAHANNTCVGKFVNSTCTKFNIGNLREDISKRIRNTLEGFPILMFFRCDNDNRVYFFGVYNFNLGRGSEYNLGYNTDIEDVYDNSTESTVENFAFSYGKCERNPKLAIGEIQENQNEFDFSQYDKSILFSGTEKGNKATMFGADSKITAFDKEGAKDTLKTLVTSVAKAGRYVFKTIGKEFGSNDKGYTIKNTVPDTREQKYIIREGNVETVITRMDGFEDAEIDDLLSLVSSQGLNDEITHEPILNYTSSSEYYTICMAFGLVDSVLKNMNLKSWNGKTCYCAFYDMDCAFGEDNAGKETITYLASTDQWSSTKTEDGFLGPVKIDYDYWDSVKSGQGFDYTSSYLFGVVKYAQAILSNNVDTKNIRLPHYPQEFWAILRGYQGELQNVDYFMSKYYLSGVHKIPAYLTSLNYRVKYLYSGEIYDEGSGSYISKDIANAIAFHGTRTYKVREWLKNRLKFLDAVMNVNDLSIALPSGILLPKLSDDVKRDITSNKDISILDDAFSTSGENRIHSPYTDVNIKIKTSKNAPLIMTKGGDVSVYLLGNTDEEYDIIKFTTSQTVTTRFLGSKEFIEVDSIEPFITSYQTIISNKLTEINYGGRSVNNLSGGLNIISPTIEKIYLPISNWGGNLNISLENNNGMSVNNINIHGSGLYGDFTNLPNLQYVNIGAIKAPEATVKFGGSKLLKGDNIVLSGDDNEHKTKLNDLNISEIAGNFNLYNTEIRTITASSDKYNGGSFNINGDSLVSTISLSWYNSVNISGCTNLSTLDISGDACTSITISGGYGNDKLKSVNSKEDGCFDFSSLHNLSKLSIIGCYVKKIILPNNNVQVFNNGLSGNENLQYIETLGEDSNLEICGTAVFSNSNIYSMRQSNGSYTKMSVGKDVTSLERTFEKGGSSSDGMTMRDVKHFIQNVVGDNVKPNITSLNRCFVNRIGIIYNEFNAADDEKYFREDNLNDVNRIYPNFTKYNSLKDISYMYNNTGVKFLYREMFNFGISEESHEDLNWDVFIDNGNRNISIDAFKYIKHRIGTINNSTFSIYEYKNGSFVLAGVNRDDMINILDVFMPGFEYVRDEDKNPNVPEEEWFIRNVTEESKNKKISSFINVNFNPNQFINLNDIIFIYPNALNNIEGFLNGDLRRLKFDTIFGYPRMPEYRNTTKYFSIKQSFNHNNLMNMGEMNDGYPIDLYNFFDWLYANHFNCLFESGTNGGVGFIINKTISYENYKYMVNCICNRKDNLNNINSFTKLTNLFAYCTITDYDDSEIKLYYREYDKDRVNNKIKSIDNLFYKCKVKNENDIEVGFNLSSKLFKFIPNAESFIQTFYGVKFSGMFSYDIFSKRHLDTDRTVYVIKKDAYGNEMDPNDDASWGSATLKAYKYNRVIKNLTRCFAETKIINNKNWFDEIYYKTDIENNSLGTDELISIDGKKYTSYYLLREIYQRYTFEINKLEIPIQSSRIRLSSDEDFGTIKNRDEGVIYCKYNYDDKRYDGKQYINGELKNVISINDTNISNGEIEKIGKDNYFKVKLLRYNSYEYSGKKELINYEFTDIKDNYTHYVKSMPYEKTYGNGVTITGNLYNHDIEDEMIKNGNISEAVDNKSFLISQNSVLQNLENNIDYGIYKTYCCLPPDFFYACAEKDVILDEVFLNSNIIGVIPRHLMDNCKNISLSNVFKNVNILPNVDYFYKYSADVDTDINKYIGIGSVFNDLEILEAQLPEKIETEDEIIIYEIDNSKGDIPSVIYRHKDGLLRRRHPIHKIIKNKSGDKESKDICIDKKRGQYVYVPSNYSLYNNIQNMFNFRFNLPEIAVLESKDGRYTSHYYGDTAVENDDNLYWNAFNQYFFLHKDSVDWENLTNASSPFISSSDDIDYSTLNHRIGNIDLNKNEVGYSWWKNLSEDWTKNNCVQTNGNFNIFLNLCCDKDELTGMLLDNGLPIVLNEKFVKIDNLVSDSIISFLSGRIFDKDFVISRVKSSNLLNQSSGILSSGKNYLGVSKNIILPKCDSLVVSLESLKVFENNVSILQDCLGVGNTSDVNNLRNGYSLFGAKGSSIIWLSDSLYSQS